MKVTDEQKSAFSRATLKARASAGVMEEFLQTYPDDVSLDGLEVLHEWLSESARLIGSLIDERKKEGAE